MPKISGLLWHIFDLKGDWTVLNLKRSGRIRIAGDSRLLTLSERDSKSVDCKSRGAFMGKTIRLSDFVNKAILLFAFVFVSALPILTSAALRPAVVSQVVEQAAVTCDIVDIGEAEVCMRFEANARANFGEPNESLVSARMDLLLELARALDISREVISAIEQSDYAGLVITAGQEQHLIYYAIRKGGSYKPQLIFNLDLRNIPAKFSRSKAALPETATFFLGLDRKPYEIYWAVFDFLEVTRKYR